MPLSWTDDLLIGHQEIDAQHRAIFDYASALIKAESYEMRLLVAKGLDNHARFHFAYEEMLMDEIGYPHAGRQKAQHAALLNRLSEFTSAISDCSQHISGLQEFIKDWLVNHIDTDDADLAEYLAANRPSGTENPDPFGFEGVF